MQATGASTQSREDNHRLRGLLLIGQLDVDPKGRHLPLPVPNIGFGNAAHLSKANICSNNSK